MGVNHFSYENIILTFSRFAVDAVGSSPAAHFHLSATFPLMSAAAFSSLCDLIQSRDAQLSFKSRINLKGRDSFITNTSVQTQSRESQVGFRTGDDFGKQRLFPVNGFFSNLQSKSSKKRKTSGDEVR